MERPPEHLVTNLRKKPWISAMKMLCISEHMKVHVCVCFGRSVLGRAGGGVGVCVWVCGEGGGGGWGPLLRGAVAYNASVIYVISLPYDGRNWVISHPYCQCCQFILLSVKNSRVSNNILNKNWSVDRRFFFIYILSPEKNRVVPVILWKFGYFV